LGHLLCDACGRLWQKDKYCPVCYKVYRNSEQGLLACATCGHSVHRACDPKPEARARPRYACPACRGEVPTLAGEEREVIEYLWKLKDADEEGVVEEVEEEGGEKEGVRKEVGEAGREGGEDEEEGNESGGEREGNGRRGEMKEPGEEAEEEARRGREVEDENERGRGRGAVVASREKRGRQEECLDQKGGNVERGDVETAEKVANVPAEGPSGRKIGREVGAEEAAADAEGNNTPATDVGPREVRRRRTPSSKFKDMQVTLKRGRRSSIQSKAEEALEGIEEQKPEAEEKEEVVEGKDGAGAVDDGNAKGGRSNKRPHEGVERMGSKRERRGSRGNEG
jgi:hypothetical protein